MANLELVLERAVGERVKPNRLIQEARRLWRVPLNAIIKTSPMTFAVGGQQYIALAVGSTIVALGL
jgi:hypothetical protein